MNNEQFRRLLFDNPAQTSKKPQPTTSDVAQDETTSGVTPKLGALGSRMRSSIPMTPRAVSSVNFARQLAEFRGENQQPPTKKFKSSAPKGTRYISGYQDRTLLRRQAEEDNDASAEDSSEAKRIKALEEMVKLGQIDQATFEKMRDNIGIGGEVNSTHLVKGLDWKLLQRVKAGEDVNAPAPSEPEPRQDDEVDIDDEFERVLDQKEKDAIPVTRKAEKVKKGNMAPPPKKMTRDEILKRLKASRATGAPISLSEEVPESTLGTRFKKIGTDDRKKRWTETDADGRRKEILLVTDAQGKTKRKVRWLDKPIDKGTGLLSANKNAAPLGMEVPADVLARIKGAEKQEEEEDNDDIFEGVGADYNPLVDNENGGSSSGSEDDGDVAKQKTTDVTENKPQHDAEGTPQTPAVRNPFFTSVADETITPEQSNPLASDPTILAALKRAAAIRQHSPPPDAEDEGEIDESAMRRRAKFLEDIKRRDREDARDLDLGFGESRFGDDDDEEEVWEERAGASNKRKRGPKKKKGDKDSASDVMKVIEGRKKAGN